MKMNKFLAKDSSMFMALVVGPAIMVGGMLVVGGQFHRSALTLDEHVARIVARDKEWGNMFEEIRDHGRRHDAHMSKQDISLSSLALHLDKQDRDSASISAHLDKQDKDYASITVRQVKIMEKLKELEELQNGILAAINKQKLGSLMSKSDGTLTTENYCGWKP